MKFFFTKTVTKLCVNYFLPQLIFCRLMNSFVANIQVDGLPTAPSVNDRVKREGVKPRLPPCPHTALLHAE